MLYKNNAATVQTRPLRGDLFSAGLTQDQTLEHRAVTDYGTVSPLLSPQDIYPRLTRWLDLIQTGNAKHAVFAGSISLEAAVGAPQARARKALLTQARHHLGDCSLEGVTFPSAPQLRKNRVIAVADLMAIRSLSGSTYKVSQLDILHRLTQARMSAVEAGNLSLAGNMAGAAMEQTVICLLHEPVLGVYAVPSFLRQDENDWSYDGLKYRWDVTVESDGSIAPAGQYRFQAKNGDHSSDLSSYHPDILIVSGSRDFGPPEQAGYPNLATEALLKGDAVTVERFQESLLTVMSDHGPAISEPQYLGRIDHH